MAVTLAMTMDQEAQLRDLARRRDRRGVQNLLIQAVEPTAAALVGEAVAPSSRAKLDHFLQRIRSEFPSLRSPSHQPSLPVTRDEIYSDHD
jgi:hypothetical protein